MRVSTARLSDAKFSGQAPWPDDLDAADKRAFGQVGAIGGADHIRVASHSGSDEMDVVGVELSCHEAQLLGEPGEQLITCPSGELVYDLSDGE